MKTALEHHFEHVEERKQSKMQTLGASNPHNNNKDKHRQNTKVTGDTVDQIFSPGKYNQLFPKHKNPLCEFTPYSALFTTNNIFDFQAGMTILVLLKVLAMVTSMLFLAEALPQIRMMKHPPQLEIHPQNFQGVTTGVHTTSP